MTNRRVSSSFALALTLALTAGTTPTNAAAQPPWAVSIRPEVRERPISIDRGAAGLWQSLLKLDTRASMIMIDAHPDDEDGALMAYESRGQGARVALLTLNRGEGGQNLMGSDLFDALGQVRTEELLAADQHYGSQQYFTSAIDFGFSKSKTDTLKEWGHDRILAQVVRVVRMVRPLVVASVFVGGHTDGHGNHQTSGQLAQEAFRDAGNPKMFPDQIREGLMPWAPLKDYARVPPHTDKNSATASFSDEGAVGFGKIFDYANSHTYPLRFFNYTTGKWIDGMLSTDLSVPEGTYDPMLGGTFVQIAREGLGEQKSQDGGLTPPPLGPDNVAYHLFGSRVGTHSKTTSMFSGINVSLSGIADLAAGQKDAFLTDGIAQISQDVNEAMHRFDPRHLGSIAPFLAAGAKANLALIEKVKTSALTAEAKYNVLHELNIKKAQFNTALAEALSLSVRVSVTTADAAAGGNGFFGPTIPRVVIPGQAFYANVRSANMGSGQITVQRVWISTPGAESWTVSPEGPAPASVGSNQVVTERFRVQVPDRAAPTEPYFSRKNLFQNVYTINKQQFANLPFAPYPVSGWVKFEYEGVPVEVGQVAQTFQRQVGYGDVAEPLVVAPAVSIWLPARVAVVPIGAPTFPFSVRVHSNALTAAEGTVKLGLPKGWTSDPASAPFTLAKSGTDGLVRFLVHPASLGQQSYDIGAVVTSAGRKYTSGYEQTGYPGLRPYYLYRPAQADVRGVDVKVAPDLKVGFVEGTGSQLPEALQWINVHPVTLTTAEIRSGDLSRFSAIIIGVRAYSVNQDLATYNDHLLNYVRGGGTLIVEYQSGDYNHGYAPYPLTVGLGPDSTVADQDSAVQFLMPDSAILKWPNVIGAQDFTGWFEERGHGFATSWGSQWKALFEMHDNGQAPQKGGLLVAHFGKGLYVYDALALYRQLPRGVPGSYRIMANLLSAGASDRRSK